MTALTLAMAERIAKAATAHARAHGHNAMGIVVIDGSTNVKYALREDGANLAAVDIALGKARAALTFGCPSRVIADALAGNPLAGPSVLSVLDGRIVLLGGGVPIADADGATIGAIGAAGGAPSDDEAIAMAGAAAV
jgi:uncharacterized protein GlcG (DUF336 family)